MICKHSEESVGSILVPFLQGVTVVRWQQTALSTGQNGARTTQLSGQSGYCHRFIMKVSVSIESSKKPCVGDIWEVGPFLPKVNHVGHFNFLLLWCLIARKLFAKLWTLQRNIERNASLVALIHPDFGLKPYYETVIVSAVKFKPHFGKAATLFRFYFLIFCPS